MLQLAEADHAFLAPIYGIGRPEQRSMGDDYIDFATVLVALRPAVPAAKIGFEDARRLPLECGASDLICIGFNPLFLAGQFDQRRHRPVCKHSDSAVEHVWIV